MRFHPRTTPKNPKTRPWIGKGFPLCDCARQVHFLSYVRSGPPNTFGLQVHPNFASHQSLHSGIGHRGGRGGGSQRHRSNSEGTPGMLLPATRGTQRQRATNAVGLGGFSAAPKTVWVDPQRNEAVKGSNTDVRDPSSFAVFNEFGG